MNVSMLAHMNVNFEINTYRTPLNNVVNYEHDINCEIK